MKETLKYLQDKFKIADDTYWRCFDKEQEIVTTLKQLEHDLKYIRQQMKEAEQERELFTKLLKEVE